MTTTHQHTGLTEAEFEALSIFEKAQLAAACGQLLVYPDYQAMADARFPQAAARRRQLQSRQSR